MKKIILVLLTIILIGASGCFPASWGPTPSAGKIEEFQAERAYRDVVYQTNLGPRIPGTPGHQQLLEWLTGQLQAAGWSVTRQRALVQGKTIQNLIASRGERTPYILIGAHYDTRILADNDPDMNLRDQPVPGANDGASGVAVLLELARTLPQDLPVPVRLAFFDAEDNGGIGSWDWIMGSRALVQDLQENPEAVIIVDMVGDADLQIYYEKNSDSEIRQGIWQAAAEQGYRNVFIPEERFSMLDDHTSFLEAGIPAVDIIDFDYPYWHTTADTADKVSPESLKAVGETLTHWLLLQD